MSKSKAPLRATRLFQVGSLDEALAVAVKLRDEQEFDLFRGQVHDWVPVPTFLRQTPEAYEGEIAKIERFLGWAESRPELAPINNDPGSLLAIAQHYGLSTPLLDVTMSLEVAAYFALDGTPPAGSEHAVLFCARSEFIERTTSCRIRRAAVPDLWRLEAQEGLFVDFSQAEGIIDLGWIAIYFPREGAHSPLPRESIYPEKKSQLELLLERFFLLEIYVQVEEFSQRPLVRRWRTFPGVFPRREVPEVYRSARDEAGAPPMLKGERWAGLNTIRLRIELSTDTRPDAVRAALQAQLNSGLPVSKDAVVDIDLVAPDLGPEHRVTIQDALEYQWDGMRQLDYSREEIAESLAATLALLSKPLDSDEEVLNVLREQFGDQPIQLRFGIEGSWVGEAECPRTELRNAIDPVKFEVFNRYYRVRFERDPVEVLGFVVESNHQLFRTGALKRLFVRYLIPSQVAAAYAWKGKIACSHDEHQAVCFEQRLLSYLSTSESGWLLPFHYERELDTLLMLFEDMTISDLYDTISGAAKAYYAEGRMYRLKLHGFAADDRPLWEIPAAVEIIRIFADMAGLALLQPSTQLLLPESEIMELKAEAASDRTVHDPGLGGFEAWLIARGAMAEVQGQPQSVIHSLVVEFQTELMHQYEKLNSRHATF